MRSSARSRSIAAAIRRTRVQSLAALPGSLGGRGCGPGGRRRPPPGATGAEAVPPAGRRGVVRRNAAHAGGTLPARSASTRARRRRCRSRPSRSRLLLGFPIGQHFGGESSAGAFHGVRVAGARLEFGSHKVEKPGGAGEDRVHLRVRDSPRAVYRGWHAEPPRALQPQHSRRAEPSRTSVNGSNPAICGHRKSGHFGVPRRELSFTSRHPVFARLSGSWCASSAARTSARARDGAGGRATR